MSHAIPRALVALRAGALLLSAWMLSACQAAAPAAGDPGALLRELDAAIGSATCTADADCRSLPIGHKACGGPEAWRAYSVRTGEAARILDLAARYRDARQQADRADGRVSDCRVLTDPGTRCGPQGRCVATPRGPGGLVY